MAMKPEENRSSPRYVLPVVAHIPGFSALPLIPEDVSSGGFKVLVTIEPRLGDQAECSIQIANEMFDNCQATVARVHDNGDGTWDIGVSIESLTEDREYLKIALEKIIKEHR